MENRILKIGALGFTISLYAIYLAIVLMTFLVTYLLIDQGANLPNWINLSEEGIFASTNIDQEKSTLNSVEINHLTILLSKMIAMSLVFSFIIRRFIKIIQSVRAKNSFRLHNVQHFKKIGVYFFILFLLDIINMSHNLGDDTVKVVFQPIYLLSTITALILAEVFREGNNLAEENKLTI